MSSLGPLERRVIEVLWSRQDAACVRDLHSDFPEIAYTTLMTTLDRLHRKGVLDRILRVSLSRRTRGNPVRDLFLQEPVTDAFDNQRSLQRSLRI